MQAWVIMAQRCWYNMTGSTTRLLDVQEQHCCNTECGSDLQHTHTHTRAREIYIYIYIERERWRQRWLCSGCSGRSTRAAVSCVVCLYVWCVCMCVCVYVYVSVSEGGGLKRRVRSAGDRDCQGSCGKKTDRSK